MVARVLKMHWLSCCSWLLSDCFVSPPLSLSPVNTHAHLPFHGSQTAELYDGQQQNKDWMFVQMIDLFSNLLSISRKLWLCVMCVFDLWIINDKCRDSKIIVSSAKHTVFIWRSYKTKPNRWNAKPLLMRSDNSSHPQDRLFYCLRLLVTFIPTKVIKSQETRICTVVIKK